MNNAFSDLIYPTSTVELHIVLSSCDSLHRPSHILQCYPATIHHAGKGTFLLLRLSRHLLIGVLSYIFLKHLELFLLDLEE